MLNVISLGAGVQSTTMALMAAHGDLTPMPDAAIFADTGAEPKAVYEHLDWLMSPNVLPFPVHVVQFGNLLEDLRASSRLEDVHGRERGYCAPPFQTRNAEGSNGILRRECTQNYKIDPIRHQVKRLLGRDPLKPIRSAEPLVHMWVGISLDEVHRIKPSRDGKWCKKVYPLVERDKPMTRWHCLDWMRRHEYPTPPRSACVFCPYLNAEMWRTVRSVPEDWAIAVEVDTMIRDFPERGVARLDEGGQLYVHNSLTPLAEVDLTDPHESQINLFGNECEGICGL